jgi:hypothetical protein
LVDINEKPKRKRVCHTCAISMDNILVESIRHSAEMSFNGKHGVMDSLAADIKKGRSPMLARSFEMGVKNNTAIYQLNEPNEGVKFNFDYSGSHEVTEINPGLAESIMNSITVDNSIGI